MRTLLTLLLASLLQTYPAPGPGRQATISLPTPVGQWNLCGDSSSSSGCRPTSSTAAYDASGNGNNGTWNGTETGSSYWYNACSSGCVKPYAGAFDGSTDYVNVPNNATLNPTAMTAIAMAYPTSWSPAWHMVVDKESGGTGSSAGYSINSGGVAGLEFCAMGKCPKVSSWPSSLNTWYCVAGTYSYPGYSTLYSNGISEGTPVATTAAITASTQPLEIGKYAAGASYYFPGQIGPVLLYSSALTQAQVAYMCGALEARMVPLPAIWDLRETVKRLA